VTTQNSDKLFAVAALHQFALGQMTWPEDQPPWLRPAYCFASVTG